MTVAMYLRKSRAEENEPVADTLSRHREILFEYAEKSNLVVVHIYEEVASGDSLYGRPEMLKLMERLPTYEAVLCMDIDRLGRGAMHEQGLIFEAFRTAGVLIITPVKTYDMRDDTDDSLISFKALFAREEYKMIRSRLRRGTLKAVSEGCYLSNAPFGYKQIRAGRKPTLEIVPREAEGVRLIFKLYCEGHGCQAIADTLHTIGFHPRRGQKFNRTTIAKIIKNPVYTGKVVWNQFSVDRPGKPDQKHTKRIKKRDEWMIVNGLHEAIIDTALYEDANRRMAERYHAPYNRGVIQNPFAGILYCETCGRAMVRQMSNKRYSRPMLLCPTAGCMMSTALDAVEDIFFAVLNSVLDELETMPETVQPNTEFDITDNARAELSRLRQQMGKLHDFFEQGVYDADTFIRRRDELIERSQNAEAVILTASRSVRSSERIERIKSVLERYWDGDARERNQLLKAVIRKAVYRKEKGSGWSTEPIIRITEWRT